MCHTIWVHLVGAVTVHVELLWIISRGASSSPEPQRGVEHTRCLTYGLLIYVHTWRCGIPPDIVCAIWVGKWWMFLVYPARWIYWPMNSYGQGHDTHWWLPPWEFIIHCRSFTTYSFIVSTTMDFFPAWKIPAKPDICIEVLTKSITMNLLGLRIPPAGCTDTFIFWYSFMHPQLHYWQK